MEILLKKITEDAIVPTRAYSTDSGLDVYANISEEIILKPLERVLVPSGIAIQLPELEFKRMVFELQVRSKSGRALKEGLVVLNSPGTIDYSYTGEIKVILANLSNKDLVIKPKEKIAQLVMISVIIPDIKIVEDISGDRGTNGFGSTGI